MQHHVANQRLTAEVGGTHKSISSLPVDCSTSNSGDKPFYDDSSLRPRRMPRKIVCTCALSAGRLVLRMYLVYLTVEVMSAEQEVLSSTSDLTESTCRMLCLLTTQAHLREDKKNDDISRPGFRRRCRMKTRMQRLLQSNPRSVVYLLGGEA